MFMYVCLYVYTYSIDRLAEKDGKQTHFPNTHSSQDWIKREPGDKNCTEVSHMDGRIIVTFIINCCLPISILGSQMQSTEYSDPQLALQYGKQASKAKWFNTLGMILPMYPIGN